jgi:hypothetical protein
VEIVALYDDDVADAIGVQGPVADGPDCHWYVTPAPRVAFCKVNVEVPPGATAVGLATVFPGVGVPEHAGLATVHVLFTV